MNIDHKIFYIFLSFLILFIVGATLIVPPLVMRNFFAIEDDQIAKTQNNIQLIINQQLNYLEGISKAIPTGDTESACHVQGIDIDGITLYSSDMGILCSEGQAVLGISNIKLLADQYEALKNNSGFIDNQGKVIALAIYKKQDTYIIVSKEVSKKIPNSFSMGQYFTLDKIYSPGITQEIKLDIVNKSNHDYVYVYRLLEDIFEGKTLYSKVIISREVYKTGLSQIEIILYLVFLSNLLLLIIFLYFIKKIITERLSILVSSFNNGRLKNANSLLSIQGNDEVSKLAKEMYGSFQKVEKNKQEIQRKQFQLDSILNSMHDSIYIFNKDKKLINSFILKNKKKKEKIKNKENILPKKIIEEIFQSLNNENKDDPIIISYSVKEKGRVFWYDASVSIKKDSSGDSIIVVVRDITSRIEMEQSIKTKLQEVERLNKVMVGREIKMIELKNKIEELENNEKRN